MDVIDGIAAKGKKKGIALGDAQLRMAPYASPQSGRHCSGTPFLNQVNV